VRFTIAGFGKISRVIWISYTKERAVLIYKKSEIAWMLRLGAWDIGNEITYGTVISTNNVEQLPPMFPLTHTCLNSMEGNHYWVSMILNNPRMGSKYTQIP
jgi:hypothetical protein